MQKIKLAICCLVYRQRFCSLKTGFQTTTPKKKITSRWNKVITFCQCETEQFLCLNLHEVFSEQVCVSPVLISSAFVCVCLFEYPGAAYCQLMDLLFPGSLDLSTVRFQSNNMADSIHNYSLLQAAFRKHGVLRVSNVVKTGHLAGHPAKTRATDAH